MLLLVAAFAPAAAAENSFSWNPPKVGSGAFDEELGMLEREREEYATNLVVYATNRVAKAKASKASLDEARRLIALSLHLAPRNKKALVANYQLSRGVLPQPVASEYSSEVLARLLFTRAQMLRRQGGEENLLLARIFTELAGEMDPRNEDAVYASEIQRLDHGRVAWSELTDAEGKPPTRSPDGGDLP